MSRSAQGSAKNGRVWLTCARSGMISVRLVLSAGSRVSAGMAPNRRKGWNMSKTTDAGGRRKLRSQAWFDNPDNIDMTALYLERMTNYGLTIDELQSGKPIIGIAQSGSDI